MPLHNSGPGMVQFCVGMASFGLVAFELYHRWQALQAMRVLSGLCLQSQTALAVKSGRAGRLLGQGRA